MRGRGPPPPAAPRPPSIFAATIAQVQQERATDSGWTPSGDTCTVVHSPCPCLLKQSETANVTIYFCERTYIAVGVAGKKDPYVRILFEIFEHRNELQIPAPAAQSLAASRSLRIEVRQGNLVTDLVAASASMSTEHRQPSGSVAGPQVRWHSTVAASGWNTTSFVSKLLMIFL